MLIRSLFLISLAQASFAMASSPKPTSVVRLFTCDTGDHNGNTTRRLEANIFLKLNSDGSPVEVFGLSNEESRTHNSDGTITITRDEKIHLRGGVVRVMPHEGNITINFAADGYADIGSDMLRSGQNMKAKTLVISNSVMPKAKIFGTGAVDYLEMSAGTDCQVESVELLKSIFNP